MYKNIISNKYSYIESVLIHRISGDIYDIGLIKHLCGVSA